MNIFYFVILLILLAILVGVKETYHEPRWDGEPIADYVPKIFNNSGGPRTRIGHVHLHSHTYPNQQHYQPRYQPPPIEVVEYPEQEPVTIQAPTPSPPVPTPQIEPVKEEEEEEAISGIKVVKASYGPNCGVKEGNVTQHLASACDGRRECSYRVDHGLIGDPAYGCPKVYNAIYRCDGTLYRVSAPPEASGKTVKLSCDQVKKKLPKPPSIPVKPVKDERTVPKIKVIKASYGPNCGVTEGNVTQHLASACNGQQECSYRIDHQLIGDPAYGCPKVYKAVYQCDGTLRQVSASPEASGKTVNLSCKSVKKKRPKQKPEWIHCGKEGDSCRIVGDPGSYQFRYGAENRFVNKVFQVPEGSSSVVVPCNNQSYGDPIYGTAKSCSFRPTPSTQPKPKKIADGKWIHCANEGKPCRISGDPGNYQFRYGAQNKFIERIFRVPKGRNNITVPCDNRTYSDPVYGVIKSCSYRQTTPNPQASTGQNGEWSNESNESSETELKPKLLLPKNKLKTGDIISLKSVHNGYLSLKDDPWNTVIADQSDISPKEQWRVVKTGRNKIALTSYRGRYMGLESDLRVSGNRTHMGATEIWQTIQEGDVIQLKGKGGLYLAADPDGKVALKRLDEGDDLNWYIEFQD